jgi:hypothetical protein
MYTGYGILVFSVTQKQNAEVSNGKVQSLQHKNPQNKTKLKKV